MNGLPLTETWRNNSCPPPAGNGAIFEEAAVQQSAAAAAGIQAATPALPNACQVLAEKQGKQ